MKKIVATILLFFVLHSWYESKQKKTPKVFAGQKYAYVDTRWFGQFYETQWSEVDSIISVANGKVTYQRQNGDTVCVEEKVFLYQSTPCQ